MNEKASILLGMIAPLVGFMSVLLSILLSPWFRWERNALSDLGHSMNSSVAPIFNGGLLLTGFVLLLYSVCALSKHAKWTGYFLAVCALSLQLVAAFDEVYGRLHFLVSVFFFVSLIPASLSYALEKRSLLAAVGLAVAAGSWLLYWTRAFSTGVAVPEALSTLAVTTWVFSSAVKAYHSLKPKRPI